MARGSITWKPARNGWEIQVSLGTDPETGKRRRRTKLVPGTNTPTSRLEDAEPVLTQMLVEADGRTVHDSSAPVSQVLEQWYAHGCRKWSPTTAHEYRRLIDRRLMPRWGTTRLRDLRRAEIMAWHDGLFASGMTLPTVRRVHAAFRAALNHAVERELLDANPAAGRGILEAEDRPGVSPPSPDELMTVLELIDEHDKDFGAFVRVASWCGLRRSEMCGLLWADVDLDQASLRVHRAIVQIGRELHVKRTKTKRDRKMRLGPATVQVLRDHRERTLEGGRIGRNSLVWSQSPDGTEPWTPDSVTARWARFRKMAGVDCRLHDLRHYMATQLLDGGAALTTVQARLGHRKASTTLDIYSHAIPARDEDAAVDIERLTKRTEVADEEGEEGAA